MVLVVVFKCKNKKEILVLVIFKREKIKRYQYLNIKKMRNISI